MKIQTKILLIVLSLVLVTGVVATIASGTVARNIAEQQAYNHLETTAQSRAHHIETLLRDQKEALEIRATSFILRNFLTTSKEDADYAAEYDMATARLSSMLEARSEFTKLSVLDKSGIVVASTDREIVLLEAGQKTEIQNALDKGRVDLVLMDIQMPEKSGMEWLAEIVEKETAPVVMMTGSGSEEIAVQSIQEGAVGYLPKSSLSKENLVNAIDAALEKWKRMQQGKADQEELERLANFDSLTGLENRRAILRRLEDQIKYAKRYKEEFSLIMLDIDHFKDVNDQYGHLTGDEVLVEVAVLVRHNIRNTDAVGRYGGEEFVIILPKTDLFPALDAAERIRTTIEAAEMKAPEGNVFGITVSQGLSSYKPGEGEHALISRADGALYRAKENGRNRVETSSGFESGKG